MHINAKASRCHLFFFASRSLRPAELTQSLRLRPV
jgi:hypothetical protein